MIAEGELSSDSSSNGSPGGDKKIEKKKKRKGIIKGAFNFLLIVAVVAAVGLFLWAEQQRREATKEIERVEGELKDLQETTQRSGEEVADEVLEKVRSLITLPEEPRPTVATIVDIERLRESNEFFQQADNGDNLILTENRAILYDPEQNVIIDVAPFQINPEATVSPTPPAQQFESTTDEDQQETGTELEE